MVLRALVAAGRVGLQPGWLCAHLVLGAWWVPARQAACCHRGVATPLYHAYEMSAPELCSHVPIWTASWCWLLLHSSLASLLV